MQTITDPLPPADLPAVSAASVRASKQASSREGQPYETAATATVTRTYEPFLCAKRCSQCFMGMIRVNTAALEAETTVIPFHAEED